MKLPQLPTTSRLPRFLSSSLLAGLLASSSVLPCQLPPPASAAALDAGTVQLALRYSELEARDPEPSFSSRLPSLPQLEWGNMPAQFTNAAANAGIVAESAAAKAAEFANNPATKAKAAEFTEAASAATAATAASAATAATKAAALAANMPAQFMFGGKGSAQGIADASIRDVLAESAVARAAALAAATAKAAEDAQATAARAKADSAAAELQASCTPWPHLLGYTPLATPP